MRTVQRINVKRKNNEKLTTPGKSRPRRKMKTSDLDEARKTEVRNLVYNMYEQSMYCLFVSLPPFNLCNFLEKHITINTLRSELRTRYILDCSYGTLRTLLLHLGFKFKIDDNRRSLMEKPEISAQRAEFLRKYMKNANSDYSRQLVFLDETWIFSKGSKQRSWQDDSIKSVRKPGGYDGKRFIVLHAGHKGGFVPNASLVFATNSKLADYHGDMNAETFIKWVTEKLIPNLEEPSLVIMDNASYHSTEIEKQPTSSWTRPAIVTWLQKHNIPFEAQLLKPELLYIAKCNKKAKTYVVDELLRENGHEVLRLPPYHCHFNAIEMIWADSKTYYNTHIGETGYGDEKVIEMWNEALNKCTANIWQAKIEHTDKVIREQFEKEKIVEDYPEFIIKLNKADSETDTSASDG